MKPDEVGEEHRDEPPLRQRAAAPPAAAPRRAGPPPPKRRPALAAELGARLDRRAAGRTRLLEAGAALAAELAPGAVLGAAAWTVHAQVYGTPGAPSRMWFVASASPDGPSRRPCASAWAAAEELLRLAVEEAVGRQRLHRRHRTGVVDGRGPDHRALRQRLVDEVARLGHDQVGLEGLAAEGRGVEVGERDARSRGPLRRPAARRPRFRPCRATRRSGSPRRRRSRRRSAAPRGSTP